MLKYLQYGSVMWLFYPLTIFALLAGGHWTWIMIGFTALAHIFLDNWTETSLKNYNFKNPNLLDIFLFGHAIMGLVSLFVLVWKVSPEDRFGFGNALTATLGDWVYFSHGHGSASELAGAIILAGWMASTTIVVAHELVHRTSEPFSLISGRWILGLVGDAQFAISHVYGHHAEVATDKDPATAKRGENAYAFFVRSSTGQYRQAFRIETQRLQNKGISPWSIKNKVISGLAITFLFISLAYFIAGYAGVGVYLLAIFIAKFLFETVNYIEHYGLVRVPGKKVEPRHSWDCVTKGTSKIFYNLSRHSDHHARASVPFWNLTPNEPNSVLHIKYGYVAMMFFALVPPLWHRITVPLLKRWDNQLATKEEAEIAKEHNLRSGLDKLAITS